MRQASGREEIRQQRIGSASLPRNEREFDRVFAARGYATGILGVAFLTVVCWLLTSVTGYSAISLIYLLGVLLSGMFLRRGPVLVVAALSALCWNFLFIPPLFTFHIEKLQDGLMFLTYFVVAITIGSLTSRLRAREQREREREQHATALYQFAQRIAAEPGAEAACAAATAYIREAVTAKATVLLASNRECDDVQTDSNSNRIIYLPIKRFDTTFGMIRVEQSEELRLPSANRELLEAFAQELANLLERDRLLRIAAQAERKYEAERLRKNLLDCVSHELKTPLAAIRAASQQLLGATTSSPGNGLARDLAHEIDNGSQRLNGVVNNLLDMTRLESGVIKPRLEWCDVSDLLHGAIESEREAIAGRQVIVNVAKDIPLALIDYSLIEQAVAKLLVNAARYGLAATPMEIDLRYVDACLIIAVADRGPGLPSGAADKVFEKFYRGDDSGTGGLGLGLSIARGFVEAHGGTLTAENRKNGGARFTIRVPVRVTDPNSLDPAS